MQNSQSNILIIAPIILALLLLLAGCVSTPTPASTPESTADAGVDDGGLQYGETAIVTSVDVQIMESFPVQVRAVIRGDLPDGCTEISELVVSRESETFTIIITTSRPIAAVCTTSLVPFEESVGLDVLDLPAGTYTVTAYGKSADFTLAVQNSAVSQPEEPAVTETAVPPAAPTGTPEPSPTPEAEALYRLTFTATWSADSHPDDFPSNPHFSNLIGAVHKPGLVIWKDGAPASPGIRRMAETGATKPLDAEVQALIDAGDACELISGGGIRVSPGSVEVTFTLSQLCPAVSVVTMIAPSPDWFVGVSDVNLMQNGGWVDAVVVELLPWDAGTDSGESYTASNTATNPPAGIARIETAPLRAGDRVPSLGTFTFTRINP